MEELYDLIKAIGEVAEQVGMSAKEFTNYLQALSTSTVIDDRVSNLASGNYSHAEGAQTTAYANSALAEGYYNINGNALIDSMKIEEEEEEELKIDFD